MDPASSRNPFGFAWDALGHLWVVDVGLGRYSVFDTTGAHLREYPRKVGGYSWPWPGRFANGLLYESSLIAGAARSLVAFRPEQDLVAADTFPQALAGQQEARDFWEIRDARGLSSFFGIPFGRSSLWTLDLEGHIWIGNSATYSLARRTLAGDTVLVLVRDAAPVDVSSDEHSRAIESLSDRATHGAVDLSRIPRTKPFFQRLLPDDLGNLWVLRQGAGSEMFFDVFAPTGAFLGVLPLPVRANLFPPPQIGRDMIVIATSDSLGVQSVVGFRIERWR